MKLKQKSLLLLIPLFISALLPIQASASIRYADKIGIISVPVVNLRSEASETSQILGKLPKNTRVAVMKSVGRWLQVSMDDKQGFIRDDCMYVTNEPVKGATAPAAGDTQARIAVSAANLRSEASVTSKRLSVISLGTVVEVSGTQDNWTAVTFNGQKGYIRSDLLNTAGQQDTNAQDTEQSGQASINATNVNFRKGPSLQESVIATLKKGVQVAVMKKSGDWYQVSVNGTTGYVFAAYVSNAPQIDQSAPSDSVAFVTIRFGTQGSQVARVQEVLKNKGYFKANVTGFFGSITLDAVKRFQTDAELPIVGYVGPSTWEKLMNSDITAKKGAASKKPADDANTEVNLKGKVELISWFSGGENLLARGASAAIVDVSTGLTYNIKRKGGYNHMDFEPLTVEDAAKMKQACGGEWTWDRRAVWLVVGDRYIAASINNMPHEDSTIANNGVDGHFCLHMKDSRVHGGAAQVCPLHQACVQQAYQAG
ncbi:MAG: SH3 domain-containing protein [Christensenellales bacterium]|jgi:uncharacterized protein YgiM (DUF1202 family)